MSKNVTRREFLRVSAVAAAGAVAVACQPQTVIVEKEKIVKETVEVEKEVTTVVKETVEVEKEVTKVVQKEVTVEIVREVQVTPVPTPTGLSQSPVLDEKVASGELPPVEMRLPMEPMVLRPITEAGEQIGMYGGTLQCQDWRLGGGAASISALFTSEWAGQWDRQSSSYLPSIVSSWELTEDYTSVRYYLRRGIKWSDGTPLTTEHVAFWWQDVQLDELLTPAIDNKYKTESGPMVLVVEDDFTFRFDYLDPKVIALDAVGGMGGMVAWAPKHHLKNWHPKYNKDAADLAQKEGFAEWYEAYLSHATSSFGQQDMDLPAMSKFVDYEIPKQGGSRMERNPYYWKVDPEGHQLPYIDYFDWYQVSSPEIYNANAVSGKYNFGGAFMGLDQYPLLAENAEKGGYRMYLPSGDAWAASPSWCFNYTTDDEVLAEIFNDLRFRMAISYSLNREEYVEVFNLGLSKPRQGLPTPAWSIYLEGADQNYLEYDLDKANGLLDEMGLKWDENKEFRLRPDGGNLRVYAEAGAFGDTIQWIMNSWKPLGIEVEAKTVDGALATENRKANKLTLVFWGSGGPGEAGSHAQYPMRLIPPWHWHGCCDMGGRDWRVWHETDGEEGKEPPQIIKDLFDAYERWKAAPMGSKEYMDAGHEMIRINAENLWWFVVTGEAPGYCCGPTCGAIANEVKNLRDPEAKLGWFIGDMLYIDP